MSSVTDLDLDTPMPAFGMEIVPLLMDVLVSQKVGDLFQEILRVEVQ